MAADNLAPCVASSSAAMILTVYNVEFLPLSELQQPAMFQSQGMKWNTNAFLFSHQKNSGPRGLNKNYNFKPASRAWSAIVL